MNNHLVKFEYNGKKIIEVTDYTNQTPLRISDGKMSKFITRKKVRKYLSNVHKMRGAQFQYVNNHYETFEYQGMTTA